MQHATSYKLKNTYTPHKCRACDYPTNYIYELTNAPAARLAIWLENIIQHNNLTTLNS